MKRKRRIFWWLLAGPLVVLTAIILEAYPFLAINRPSGGEVLVVEGWMEPVALQEAAQLAQDSAYAHIYTTGTVRVFAYYLSSGEGIDVELHDPEQGTVAIDVSGTNGAGFRLIADRDTLLDMPVTPRPNLYQAILPDAVTRVRVEAWTIHMDPGTPEIFVGHMSINEENINFLQRNSQFTFPNTPSRPAWPTYAQSARDQLIELGLSPDRITAVPAYGKPRSRSWGNAHAFAEQAGKDGITAFDVATVGVHARRSRDLFQAACGPSVAVGVVSLTDPHCTKANWWHTFRGWFTVLKEVVGAPEVQAVEITR
ncbi:MAG: hypothetical protein IPL81_12955 [Flavobacteriales bacterium]|nr:hypothetical protein [Flavobacteriales bacterium]MBK9060723.1 hypothetical protein [Flavobacteriales bacterium]HQV37794.1 hypothetical protein [Flavobacteriales bacterium]HQW31546.1 hypothetical protein [Flavobacteriales bacterium]HQY01571.1 hypothetical protein [Flavobacteriales bacterium]